MSSGMVRQASPERVSLADDLDLGEDDGDGGDFFRNFVGTVNEGGGSSYSGVLADMNDDVVHTTELPPPPAVAKAKAPMKRKRRQSVGSSKLEAFLGHSKDNSDRLVTLFQEEVTSRGKEAEEITKRGLEIVDRMVNNNLIEEGSPLWCFIISKTNSRKAMNIMLNLADDEKRVKWMKWEHERS